MYFQGVLEGNIFAAEYPSIFNLCFLHVQSREIDITVFRHNSVSETECRN